jgi:hypothetical protein
MKKHLLTAVCVLLASISFAQRQTFERITVTDLGHFKNSILLRDRFADSISVDPLFQTVTDRTIPSALALKTYVLSGLAGKLNITDTIAKWVTRLYKKAGTDSVFAVVGGLPVYAFSDESPSESDPVYVASTWFGTVNNSSNWNVAYGWGNHASAGYVPQTRQITINGVTYNLNADRTWTISGVNLYNTSDSLTGNRFVNLGTNKTLSFGRGANTYLHFFNNGNVWFGNGTPTDGGYKIDVNGAARYVSGSNSVKYMESGTVFYSVTGAAGSYLNVNSGNTFITMGTGGPIQARVSSSFSGNSAGYQYEDGVFTINSSMANAGSKYTDGVVLNKGYFGNIGSGTKHIYRITNHYYSNITTTDTLKGLFIDLYASKSGMTGSFGHVRAIETTEGDVLFNTRAGKTGIGFAGFPTSQLDVKGVNGYNQLRLRISYTPTSTSDSNGNIGDVSWDDSFIYLKTSAGWKRTALSTF